MPPASPAAFTPAALTFLRQLKRHNDRDWFQPRKAQFDQLLRQPMLALTADVTDDLRSFAVDHVRPAAKAVHRIYRDVRFSKDKLPYKTQVSAAFPRAGLAKDAGAVYYFGVSPDGVEVAAGLYMPGPVELAAVRADIRRDAAGFAAVIGSPPLVRRMGPCRGDRLVRVPKGVAADDPAADLLRHKQFYFFDVLDAAAATRPGLRLAIVDRFRAMAPFVDHVNEVLLADVRRTAEAAPRPARPAPMF